MVYYNREVIKEIIDNMTLDELSQLAMLVQKRLLELQTQQQALEILYSNAKR